MKRMLVILIAGVFACLFTGPLFAQNVTAGFTDARPTVQLALLLDTSNSMDGLISQAKSRLWKIVLETGRMTRHGERPRLQVALYEYGNDSLSAAGGYIREVLPFTGDLDEVSDRLFRLDTNGGSEYCGQVIMKASRRLQWNDRQDTLKLIFIAGNEPFNQGPISYATACERAADAGIVVNTIFCGDYREGRLTFWEAGAHLTGGRYVNIDSDYQHRYIQAPQDEKIAELNQALNDTYLAYGEHGAEKKALQETQDANAAGINQATLLDRARVKSSSGYSNSAWDLVDACEEGSASIDDLTAGEMPEEMRTMSPVEREEYIGAMQAERRRIKDEIERLSEARDLYLLEQETGQPAKQEAALDDAIIDALTNAAVDHGYQFE